MKAYNIIYLSRIEHDNSGSGWHLNQVKIEKGKDQVFVFPCNKWLDTKHEDGLIERILFPIESNFDKVNKYKDFIGSKLKHKLLK
jgi:hypothetical protein